MKPPCNRARRCQNQVTRTFVGKVVTTIAQDHHRAVERIASSTSFRRSSAARKDHAHDERASHEGDWSKITESRPLPRPSPGSCALCQKAKIV